MDKESGRVPSGSGSHPSGHAADGVDGASRFDPSRDSCANCRHWFFDRPDWQFDNLHIGECKAIKMRETIEADAVEGTLFNRYDTAAEPLIHRAMEAAKAIAVDGSGYYAALRTFGDFGCVLHDRSDSDTRPKDGDAKPGSTRE